MKILEHTAWPIRSAATVVLILLGVASAMATEPVVTLTTVTATFGIDAKGSLCTISRKPDGRECLAAEQPAPVLSVRVAGKLYAPESAVWDRVTRQLTLDYGGAGVTAVLTAHARLTHAVFELVDVQPADRVELVLWGPYPITIGEIIGDTVGVVRDREFAVGIQALNVKTLGGYPGREDDLEQGGESDDRGDYPNLPSELRQKQSFRGDTAKGTAFGSVLQAYCRNRDKDRVISNWGHEKYMVPAIRDGGVVGSKLALFACPAPRALETLGAIEIAEDLPHPMIDGVWGKTAPGANASYLIVDFGESNVDQAIAMAKSAGLKYLYHGSPFDTWGHFKLKKDLFPHGWDGFRMCVKKAGKVGVRIGFHTLSNFITPNDAYVTPKPDPRLARIGSSELIAPLDVSEKVITVASPDFFKKKTAMNTVVIGEELIRYSAVSAQAPWQLLDCERGAWGTRAAAHVSGQAVGRLLDHDYKVFLGDAGLSREIARNVASLFNDSGSLQLSFDGLEGNWSTGTGQYGCALFTKTWYDALAPEVRGRVINDASGPGHFSWHIYTRMNWGEPWYAGFRESQTLYRFKNQFYFERNLMPHMLGWFAIGPETSVEDAEWLLARAAGFDAGFALATSLASTAQLEADPSSADAGKRHSRTGAILEAVNQWETARMAGAFSPSVKAALRDNALEFHLQPATLGRWDLSEVRSTRFSHDAGQLTATESQFENTRGSQPLQWFVRGDAKQAVAGLYITINGTRALELTDRPLPPNGTLQYRGGPNALIADAAGKELARVSVKPAAALIAAGTQRVSVGCVPQKDASLKIELRTLCPALRVVKK